IGTYIAFHFWDFFRIWTGYLNSTLEPKGNNNYRFFGQHISIGVGFRLYDGLMLNFQDARNQFTQLEDDITKKTSGLASNIKTEAQSIGLSYVLLF
ncbi:MAG: hypothetical protein OEW87_10690, partial [Flavobacteriaceae bacterium]|nr:hypothetical protein [Flavobacteriaceae bacterium]